MSLPSPATLWAETFANAASGEASSYQAPVFKQIEPHPPRIYSGPCRQELRGQLDREKADFQEIAVQQHLVLEQHEAAEAQLAGQLAAARQELEQVSFWLIVSLWHLVVGTASQVQLDEPLAAVRQEVR